MTRISTSCSSSLCGLKRDQLSSTGSLSAIAARCAAASAGEHVLRPKDGRRDAEAPGGTWETMPGLPRIHTGGRSSSRPPPGVAATRRHSTLRLVGYTRSSGTSPRCSFCCTALPVFDASGRSAILACGNSAARNRSSVACRTRALRAGRSRRPRNTTPGTASSPGSRSVLVRILTSVSFSTAS